MFESSATLLNSGRLQEIRSLILDIDMPGINDLEVQRQLAEMRYSVPTIVVTGGTALRKTSLLRGDSR
jgi:FixJ family two-component response regulator